MAPGGGGLLCCFRGPRYPAAAAKSQNYQEHHHPSSSSSSALWKAGQKVKLVFLGLDDAGKTSLIHALQGRRSQRGREDENDANVVCAPPPTTSPQSTCLTLCGLRLLIKDVPGRRAFRESWQDHASDADALVFVLDSTDRMRLPVAELELSKVKRASKIPILVLATKTDIATTTTTTTTREEVEEEVEVEEGLLPAEAAPCSAVNPDGVRSLVETFLRANSC
ncbi:ADP-ribosylation factor small GTPase [Chloropicon primus]|uniref:ADP-ribosylation factor small GTPase n=1 Tax=Chloropicon primus TaxID=1764295 RepID=A0A5B8MYA6_9CHLO|nr:ADP-ribosylation factor small GTPase [Chloropicon primus]UPR04790.1 ADP-ribosylation factor small GTPase [Chloropicon primus]|eukprot:QDZ25593.1 ADP-ribosylation factor small GTPase [Chloropicon primus]